MACAGSFGMVSVENEPWDHRNMDCNSVQLFCDNDSQPCLLLLGAVEKVGDYQDPKPVITDGIDSSQLLVEGKPLTAMLAKRALNHKTTE